MFYQHHITSKYETFFYFYQLEFFFFLLSLPNTISPSNSCFAFLFAVFRKTSGTRKPLLPKRKKKKKKCCYILLKLHLSFSNNCPEFSRRFSRRQGACPVLEFDAIKCWVSLKFTDNNIFFFFSFLFSSRNCVV